MSGFLNYVNKFVIDTQEFVKAALTFTSSKKMIKDGELHWHKKVQNGTLISVTYPVNIVVCSFLSSPTMFSDSIAASDDYQ